MGLRARKFGFNDGVRDRCNNRRMDYLLGLLTFLIYLPFIFCGVVAFVISVAILSFKHDLKLLARIPCPHCRAKLSYELIYQSHQKAVNLKQTLLNTTIRSRHPSAPWTFPCPHCDHMVFARLDKMSLTTTEQ